MLLHQATPPPLPSIPFDPNQLIPLIGMIGGMLLAGVVLWRFFTSDVASAIAERIRPRALDSTVRDELQALREDLLAELQHTRQEVSELSERVDFTERLLAKKSHG